MKRFVLIAISFFLVPGILHAQSADVTPPTKPGAISVSVSHSVQVNVSWGASTDNVGVAGYRLYRNGVLVADTSDLSYTEVAPNGGYSYSVVAYDAAENVSPISGPSPVVVVTQDTIAPSAPTWISLVPATSSIVLSWNAATDNVGVVGYYIYKNGNKLPMSSALTATTYTDTGLSPGSTFTYQIKAYDAAGNTSDSNSTNAKTLSDITPPAIPILFGVTARSTSEIDFRWQPVWDNVAVTGYYVYRNGSSIANVSSTQVSYADMGLSGNSTYSYTVAAYDAAANVSAQSNPVQGTTLPADVVPPDMPNYFTGKAVSASEIDLSWQVAADNVGIGGYHVYRNDARITDTTSTSYADKGLSSSTAYTYAVEAYDTSGNISPQSSISVMTFAVNPVVPTGTASVAATAAAVSSTAVTTGAPAALTTSLYFGLRSNDVKSLQSFLVQHGYLASQYASGYFGTITQKAVQQFQCDQQIVCSGSPAATGWGSVGAKTRTAVNALLGGGQAGTATATVAAAAAANTSAAATLLQLQAQLQALQAQLQGAH